LNYQKLLGQDCQNACGVFITNGNLELIDVPEPPFENQPTESFQNGWVTGWFASHGNAHHVQYDPNLPGLNNCLLNWEEQTGEEIPCMVSQYSEGIFTNINLVSTDEFVTYCFSMDVAAPPCYEILPEYHFRVALTNTLVPLAPGAPNPLILPFVTPQFELLDEEINDFGTFNFTSSFKPYITGNYTQLWIHSCLVSLGCWGHQLPLSFGVKA